MLGPDRIKPFLLHDDLYVRRAATDYFTESRSRDPDLIPLVLEAGDRVEGRERLRSITACDQLVIAEPALDQILDRLSREKDASAIRAFNQLVVSTPVELTFERFAAICGNHNVRPSTVTRLERRRDLATWSGDRLWKELQDFAYGCEDTPYVNDALLSYSRDLIDSLARHEVPDEVTLARLLQSLDPDKNPREGWLEIFLVDLAGAKRIRRAVPALVDKFHVDTDYLLDRCKIALAMIGDPEACRLIREAYPRASKNFRLFTCDIFGTIKHESSEDAVIALLEIENDATYRTSLCMSLCGLFSERAVEVVNWEIERGYDREWTNLEEDLLPVLTVLGLDHPETERWKKEREVNERGFAARLAELEELDRKYMAQRASQNARDPRSELRQIALPQEPIPAAGTTIRRTEPRVGRNDSCPCGSGKKFKKCCGRSA